MATQNDRPIAVIRHATPLENRQYARVLGDLAGTSGHVGELAGTALLGNQGGKRVRHFGGHLGQDGRPMSGCVLCPGTVLTCTNLLRMICRKKRRGNNENWYVSTV